MAHLPNDPTDPTDAALRLARYAESRGAPVIASTWIYKLAREIWEGRGDGHLFAVPPLERPAPRLIEHRDGEAA